MKLKKAQIFGFIFTVLVGTALHFVYEWSQGSPIVGAFAPVNESVWEHLKLLLIPILVFGIFEYFSYGRQLSNFIPVRVLSIILGMAIIIVGFYTYSGIIGKSYFIVDILLFVIAAFAAYSFSNKLLKTNKFSSKQSKWLAILGILIIIGIFVLFTFLPPHINLFIDPNSGSYGIQNK